MEDYTEDHEGYKNVEEVENLDINMDNAKAEVKQLASSVYDTSMTCIIMALALTAALAWNDLIKCAITTYVGVGNKAGSGITYHFVYAILVTILFAIIYSVFKRWLKADLIQPNVQYAVIPR